MTLYLLQQNYKPDKITILSLYLGQLLLIKKKIMNNQEFKEHPIKYVKIVTVDNY